MKVNIVGAPDSEGARALPTGRQALHRAALTLDVPYRIVQLLHPERDAARLEALSLPPEPSPAAYVCLGAMCSAPVSGPEQLAETVREMQKAMRRL